LTREAGEEIRLVSRADFSTTAQKFSKVVVLLRKISREHVRFPGNDMPKFPIFSWPTRNKEETAIAKPKKQLVTASVWRFDETRKFKKCAWCV